MPSTVYAFCVRRETLMENKLFLLNWGYFVSPVDSLDESHSVAVFLLNAMAVGLTINFSLQKLYANRFLENIIVCRAEYIFSVFSV